MLSIDTRLNCKRSYATEETPHIMCEVDNRVCDGKLYECCLWGLSLGEEMALIAEAEKEEP